MKILILLLALAANQTFAWNCKDADKVKPPPSTCTIFHGKFGIPWKMCSGVLIAPNQVLTTVTCAEKSMMFSTTVACGDEKPIPGKMLAKDNVFNESKSLDIIKPASDEIASHNMAVIQLDTPSKMLPAKVEMDTSLWRMNDCFVAGGGADAGENADLKKIDGSHKACKINEYGPFGHSKNTVVSEKIAENADLGSPLYCTNAKGEYVVRAIHTTENSYTDFYQRLDANPGFLNPIVGGKSTGANAQTTPVPPAAPKK